MASKVLRSGHLAIYWFEVKHFGHQEVSLVFKEEIEAWWSAWKVSMVNEQLSLSFKTLGCLKNKLNGSKPR